MESIKNKPLPVVFLLGTTGVGKSKLSLDLAEKLHGEIINADSMQIYSGNAGVMTAKPSAEEKMRAPHHLYDVVDLDTKDFNVNKYLDLAIPAIEDIYLREKLPIVVGGTNYYIEGLLFEKGHEKEKVDWDAFSEKIEKLIQELPELYKPLLEDLNKAIPDDNKAFIESLYAETQSVLLHDLLKIVDPKMAEYLHVKDTRRVINALVKCLKYSGNQFYQSTDEKEIKTTEDQNNLRYYPILIWMKASPEILEKRIEKRIYQMINDQGGLEEIFSVFDFHHSLSPTEPELDFEKGILQAIGYKEFYPVYELYKQGKTPSEQDIFDAKLRLKQKTIDYTKYQIKWLNKRVGTTFPAGSYLLTIDLDDPKFYEEVALNKALEHFTSSIQRYQKATTEQVLAELSDICLGFTKKRAEKIDTWQKYHCEACDQELNGEKQWQEHTATRKHKNTMHRQYKASQPQKPIEKKKKEKNAAAEDLGLFSVDKDDQEPLM